MLYINNELFKRTTKEDKDSYEKFCREFDKHLDQYGRIRQDNPIILKYASHLVKPDMDNPGKLVMPKSMKLNFVVNSFYNGQMAEVRYSRTAGIPQRDGSLKFTDNGTQVVGGRLAITDNDLAYFIWRFSSQIVTKVENSSNPLAFFEVENPEGERRAIARKKNMESTITARLWNEMEDGGLSDEAIKTVAKNFMIPNVDAMDDINELKLMLEKLIKLNPANADIFLTLTDKKNAPKEEIAERRSIIANAIENGIISQDSIRKSFFMMGPDGKPEGKPIFTYQKGEKDPKGALFIYLEGKNPEMLDELKNLLSLRSA
jgi:hypothetical protein